MNAPAKSPGGSRSISACRILVVDDDLRLASSMQGMLTLHGYEVDRAGGGREAIERLAAEHYDILLLDLMMPEISGLDVLQHLRDSNIVTIVVSGETSIDDVSSALRLGAHDYMKKPYVAEELLSTISTALRKKRLEDLNRDMQGRLDRSEKLHRFIVNSSPDIIFILDQEGRFSFVNNKVEQLLQFSREELLGQPFASIVETDDQDKVSYLLEHAQGPETHQHVLTVVLRDHSGQRRRRHFQLTVSSIAETSEFNSYNRSYHVYGTARDISEQVEAEEFINFQAYHDILTRLPNRTLFKDRLSVAIKQARRNGENLAVMFIDLDRFKIINDSLGHTMGDRLLQAVSQRLLGCIRQGDTLSRFGGDEFTLLLPDVQQEAGAVLVAEKILQQIKEPFLIAEHEIFVGASIGIALYPQAGENLETLIRNADIAMYRMKNTGKDGYQIFSEEMNTGLTQRHSLEQDLRKALQNNELEICYQPLVDSGDNTLHGVEALLRWNHPERGRLPPADFIPIAEDSRLIIEIDRHTLRLACQHVVALHRSGHPTLRLSVNLSPLVVEREDFVENVLLTLKETGFPPRLLELEITEGLLLSDRHDVVEKLERLTESGVTLAIDDFGTGFSSLSYLHKFPISTLKIDRSFIQTLRSNTDGACIVTAIVSMAQGLKMKIVAEGVEQTSQLAYLRSLGCNIVQGYLFGKAGSLEELVRRYPAGQPNHHMAIL